MTIPHKHAEVIKAWADGKLVQFKSGADWISIECTPIPSFDIELEWRVKPDAPKWPKTTMESDALYHVYDKCKKHVSISLIEVANAAIAHECQSGALVPADTVQQLTEKAYTQGAIMTANAIGSEIADGKKISFRSLEEVIDRLSPPVKPVSSTDASSVRRN